MISLPDKARAAVAAEAMLSSDSVVLAMVSGGADSVALLRLLASGGLGSIGELSVLHVNHGLRASAADADEAFVVSLCGDLGVRCRVVSYDVAAYAALEGLNVEDAGRKLRYRFAGAELDARCEAAGVPASVGRIAVAHTFDDRLETFLARLVTGAGTGGLRSIAPVRERVVRPLIDVRRGDVEAYLVDLGQGWREDATNEDTSRQRAWIRHELLPVIERRNTSFENVAARMMRILGEEDEVLSGMAEAFAHDFTHSEGGALHIDRAAMLTLSRPMARRTVRQSLIAAFPEASRLEFEHVEALVDGLADDAFARDLPSGLRAEVEYSTLRISRRPGGDASVAPGLLEFPGTAGLGAAGTMRALETGEVPRDAGVERVAIDADVVRWPLVIGSVREGDRIRPFGMEGTKKVGDLLTDAKVPKRLRSLIPVVRDGDRVVWVAGVRLSDECRVGPHTKRIAELVWDRATTE